MLKRALVNVQDIVELWNDYFDSEEPFASSIAGKVRAGAAGTVSKVFLRYTAPSEPNVLVPTDHLLDVGRYLAGSALKFRQMFGDDILSLTFDTESHNLLYVIPFRTESHDERAIDTIVVLYGQDIAFLAFRFVQLSETGRKPA